MKRSRIQLAAVMVALSLAALPQLCAQSNPNVTLSGTLQGANGLPAANNVLSFTPSQTFFIPAESGGGGCDNTVVLQLNGSPLPLQCLLNFNNTTPAAPSGSLNVIFQADTLGNLSGYVPEAISGLTAGVIPIASGPTHIENSIADYGVTVANQFSFLAGVNVRNGGLTAQQVSAIGSGAGYDSLWADSAVSRWRMSNNGGSSLYLLGMAAAATPGNCLKASTDGIDPTDAGAPCGNGAVGSLTTTGATGAATLVGGVLNIPNYATAGFPGTNGFVFNTSTTASRNAATSDMATLLQGASGCSTSGNVYSPQSNTCVPGGGAVFPGTNAVVVNTSTTASRNAVYGDVVALWPSCSGYLKSDGTCGTSSGGGSPGGAIYNLQFQGAGSTFSGLSGLTTDSSGVGNLYTKGLLSQVVANPLFSGGTFAADQTSLYETRNYGQIYTQGGSSTLDITQIRQQTPTFAGVSLLSNNEGSIGESTQMGENSTYTSYSVGQNIGRTDVTVCFAVGDCISENHYLTSTGGTGQISAEGAHGFWEQLFSGGNASATCTGGCAATSIAMDTNTIKPGQSQVIYDQTTGTTAIVITGYVAPVAGQPFSEFTATGLSGLGTSTIFQTATAVPPPSPNPTSIGYVPPAITIAISTSPTLTGAATSTGGVASSGYGCLVNPPSADAGYESYERLPYATVDGTHFSINPWKPHASGSVFSVGGVCGYGVALSATTAAAGGAQVVLPLIAALDSTHFTAVGGSSGYHIGAGGAHGYMNASCSPTLISRAIVGSTWTNYITVGSCTGLASGTLNQVTSTVAGISEASGSFNQANVLMTSVPGVSGQYSYTSTTTGAISPTSVSDGTVTAGNPGGTVYPVAIVTNPADAGSTGTPVDGVFSTTPWTVLAFGDVIAISLPYNSDFNGGQEIIQPNEDQTHGPTGYAAVLAAGASRDYGEASSGFYANNAGSFSQYIGYGGTYVTPTAAFYSTGPWSTLLSGDAPVGGNDSVLFVNDTPLKDTPGTGCFGYAIFGASNSPISMSILNCQNLGDPQAATLTISSPNVTLGISAIQIFNDVASGQKILLNNATTISTISGVDLTLTGGTKSLVAANEADFNAAVYMAGLTSTTGITTCVVAGSGTQLFTETCPGGTVTAFSAGNLSPLFTTSVATSTTTPALTFALSNAAANTIFGNLTGSSAPPSFVATQGTDSKVLTSGTVSGTAGVTLCTDSVGGATTTGCSGGGSSAWSALTNPTGSLALAMAAYTSTFTYGATTGTSDLFALTDTTSNTGTGILFHAHTQTGSTEIPWQADANGCGWQITAAGVLKGVGCSTNQHGISLPASSAGVPSPVASFAGIFTDASGNVWESDAGGTYYRICTSGNTQCSSSAPAFTSLTDGTTVTWALASAPLGNAALLFTTHGGSRTLNVTGLANGGSYVLKVTQDGTGGEGLTLGTGCAWKVSGGGSGTISPSTSANALDVLAFTYDGANCLVNFNKNFD